MKRILFFLLAAGGIIGALTLSGCSDKNEPGMGNGRIKLDRLDISGSKNLLLMESDGATRSGSGNYTLFKMDADGNLSAVAMSVTVDADGNSTKTMSDISVHPREIYSMGGRFTYLYDCSFSDKEGKPMWLQNSDDYTLGYQFHILVNNGTGKIYRVPCSVADEWWFSSNSSSYVDESGNLYVRNPENKLARVSFNGDNAVISTVGPQDKSWYGDMMVLNNGTIAFQGYFDHLEFLYPNGGFQELRGDSDNDREVEGRPTTQKDRLRFSFVGNRIFAIRLPKENFQYYWKVYDDGWNSGDVYLNKDVSVEIVEILPGTSYGGITISQPIASLSAEANDDSIVPEDWTPYARDVAVNQYFGLNGIFATGSRFFLGSILVYDADTDSWTDLVKEGIANYVIFPNQQNTYNGRAWKVWSTGASWFDIGSLQYGEVNYPEFGEYQQLSETANIPQGKLIRTMLSPYDGKKYIFTIDIETGEYQTSEVEQSANVISLIPLN